MKVKMNDVIKLFVDLGFTTAPRWSLERLKRKVDGLPDVIDEDTDASESQALLDDLLVDLDNEDEIVILETEAEDPKPKKKKAVVVAEEEAEPEPEEEETEEEAEPEEVESDIGKPFNQFRDLTTEEVEEFKEWTRENYQVHSEINPVWHPKVRQECELMNEEEEDSAALDAEPEKEEGEEAEPVDFFKKEVAPLLAKIKELEAEVKRLKLKIWDRKKSSSNGKPRKKGKKKSVGKF